MPLARWRAVGVASPGDELGVQRQQLRFRCDTESLAHSQAIPVVDDKRGRPLTPRVKRSHQQRSRALTQRLGGDQFARRPFGGQQLRIAESQRRRRQRRQATCADGAKLPAALVDPCAAVDGQEPRRVAFIAM